MKLHTCVLPAPMAGISDRAYRRICREAGSELTYTEMVSSEALVRNQKKTWELCEIGEQEGPVGVQIFGSRPEVLGEAARLIEEKGSPKLIDINMGCPVRKVVKSGAGAALLENPSQIRDIISHVVKAVDVPVTIKIRTGTSNAPDAYLEIARIAEGEGVAAICLHPRLAEEGFKGNADWEKIKRLKQLVGIVVIGNGDIRSSADALEMRHHTGCDAVMIGRGAWGNPWLLSECHTILTSNEKGSADFPSVTIEMKCDMAVKHLRYLSEYKGEEKALRLMRKHVPRYFRSLMRAKAIRSSLIHVHTIKEFESHIMLLKNHGQGCSGEVAMVAS